MTVNFRIYTANNPYKSDKNYDKTKSRSVSTRKTKRLNEITKNICNALFLNIDFSRNNGYNNSRIISRGAL